MKATKRKRESTTAAAVPEAVQHDCASPAPVVVLASNCTVKDAASLQIKLCEVAHVAAVTLDIRSVERVDTATMQLLCAFVRDRATRGQAVTWLGESPAFQDAARLLGVLHMLAFISVETLGAVA